MEELLADLPKITEQINGMLQADRGAFLLLGLEMDDISRYHKSLQWCP